MVPRFWLWLVIWYDGKSGRPLVGPLRVPWGCMDQGMAQCVETAVSSRVLFVKAKRRLNPQEVWIQAQNAKGAQVRHPRGAQVIGCCVSAYCVIVLTAVPSASA